MGNRGIHSLNGTLLWESVPYDYPLFVLDTITQFLFTCGACSERVFELNEEQPILVH